MTAGYASLTLTAGAAVLVLRTANSREDPMTAGYAAPAGEDIRDIDLTAASASD